MTRPDPHPFVPPCAYRPDTFPSAPVRTVRATVAHMFPVDVRPVAATMADRCAAAACGVACPPIDGAWVN